jgi:hypothetical protein
MEGGCGDTLTTRATAWALGVDKFACYNRTSFQSLLLSAQRPGDITQNGATTNLALWSDCGPISVTNLSAPVRDDERLESLRLGGR